jgi:hypothetical protein
MGKSSFVRELVAWDPALEKPTTPLGNRIVVIDAMGEYEDACEVENPRALAMYLNQQRDSSFNVVYRDKGRFEFSSTQLFDLIKNLRDCWVIVEEASNYCTTQSIDSALKWLLQYGRHNRISLMLVARRPSELNRMCTSQADVIVTFRLPEPADRDYVRDVSGDEALADRVQRLEMHEFEIIRDNHAEFMAILDAVSEEQGNAGPEPDRTVEDTDPAVDAGDREAAVLAVAQDDDASQPGAGVAAGGGGRRDQPAPRVSESIGSGTVRGGVAGTQAGAGQRGAEAQHARAAGVAGTPSHRAAEQRPRSARSGKFVGRR